MGWMRSDTLAVAWITSSGGDEQRIITALTFDPRQERGRFQAVSDIGDGCYLPDMPDENIGVIGLAVFEAEQEQDSCEYGEADEVTEAWLLDREAMTFRPLDPAAVVCYRGVCP